MSENQENTGLGPIPTGFADEPTTPAAPLTPAEKAKATKAAKAAAAKVAAPAAPATADSAGPVVDQEAKPVEVRPSQQKKFRIVLEDNSDIPPTGLFIGINGRSYMLRPAEEVVVPQEVLAALDDAVMETPRLDGDSNIIDYRQRKRFPYRLIEAGV